MAGAMQGMKVLDMTHVMAGPFCTRQLVLLGADVIKIERPGEGDVMRYYGHDPRFGRNSPNFVGYNAGKKSVALDWTTELGAEALRRLVAEADVIVENFRPGVLQARGFGYEACKAIKPDIIYCSISGYGQESILRDNPAYDHIAQAMSGLMSLQGTEQDPPMKVGFPLVDTFSGHMAAFAIVSALLRRAQTGEGQRLDVSMLDASMVLMSAMILKYNATGDVPKRVGNKGFSLSATADMFPTKDRPISIGANTDKQFAALCKVLGVEELVADPRYQDASGRWEHADTLRPVVSAKIAEWEAEVLEVELNKASVPAAVVRDLKGIVAHPHFEGRPTFQSIDVPAWGREMKVLNGGFIANEDTPQSTVTSPDLGEHTEEVLRSLGFEGEKLESLIAGAQLS
ncbi:CaiB/BaiF CoA transferase family protein [Aquamicrobium zhengzhouense]|uniref:CoA transferase n=1 Tax=Aquamicrobium zhengzhouense TaxID=2781738 RepID=A0ABS0SD58_9HYPH|nr:CoA transferase [Aquamicrobium zhengzhouense]MBI1621228.1 CoA transferase [Aquamicrobium zhengzhouense]